MAIAVVRQGFAPRVGISLDPVFPVVPSRGQLFHLSQKPWNFASPPDTLSGMHKIIEIFADRAALHTEILALRQQVAVLKRKRPRPSLRKADRVFWVILSCLWPGWRHALVIVRPETVIGWHRKGFRLFWTWKSRRGKPGRPPVSREIRHLVRRMSRENTRWGAPRIHGELLKLGFSISQAAVSKYMVRYPSPPSQSWRTFLTNHADCLASIDFFVVPTATFHLLFGFIVLHHERRQIVHFGVTANPTMAWVAQQIREAFPWGTAPRYLIRDRDGAYGQSFRSTVTAMGVEEVVTAPRSPWQNPYVERLIGSVRRECLDHSIILNERHLRRILGSYLDYYHGSRTHLSLGKDTPDGRPVQPAGSGTVVSLPKVGGLHHRYERLAADHPRSDSINSSLWQRGRCRHPQPLHRFAGTIRRNKHRDDRAHGRLQCLSVATWTLPASACPCIGSLARSGGISIIVMTAPMVDYKIHWLKMMSVPESRAVVGRHDGINGRDGTILRRREWKGQGIWTALFGPSGPKTTPRLARGRPANPRPSHGSSAGGEPSASYSFVAPAQKLRSPHQQDRKTD